MSVNLTSQTKKALAEILKFCLENPYSNFYRNKYASLRLENISEDNIENLFPSLPLLTKDELLASAPFDRLFTDTRSPHVISHTSGTTGKEPTIIFINTPAKSPEGQLTWGKINAKCGLFLFPPGVQWQLLTTMTSAFPVYIGNPYQMKETAEIASRIKIDAIATTPTALQHFLNFLEPVYDISKIKHILLRGESLSKTQRALFRQKFPNALFNLLYGMREAGQIGIQCDILSMSEEPVYHLRSDKFLMETLPADDKGNKELVVTHLRKDPTILIRYKTGDLGEFVENKNCACGLAFPLFKLTGRSSQNTVRAGGVTFYIETFSKVLNDYFDNVQNNFEAHFYQRLKGSGIVYEIIIKLPSPKNNPPSEVSRLILEESLNNIFISNRIAFGELIKQGIFLPIKVEYASPDSATLFKSPIPQKLISHF